MASKGAGSVCVLHMRQRRHGDVRRGSRILRKDLAGQVWLQLLEKRVVYQIIGYSRFLKGWWFPYHLKWNAQLRKKDSKKVYEKIGTMARNPHII